MTITNTMAAQSAMTVTRAAVMATANDCDGDDCDHADEHDCEYAGQVMIATKIATATVLLTTEVNDGDTKDGRNQYADVDGGDIDDDNGDLRSLRLRSSGGHLVTKLVAHCCTCVMLSAIFCLF